MERAEASLRTLVERFDAGALDDAAGRVRLEVPDAGHSWEAVIDGGRARLVTPSARTAPDALLSADSATWARIAEHLPAGMDAFRAGRLRVRRNLHLGVGFLAATSGDTDPGRLRFRRIGTPLGTLATMEAGVGQPLLLLHGLGGTKASFLPTLAALASPRRRLIAVDLPGFGDSDKPLAAPYDPPFFARWTTALLGELGIERCDLLGHSLGGRAALEVGFSHPQRVRRLVLMTPSLAWLRERRWAPYLRFVRPELGLLQLTPRRVAELVVRRVVAGGGGPWTDAAIDEFLRAYLTARGRTAFYAAARHVYLEEPERFWSRLRSLAPASLFIWGRQDGLVPTGFMRHVERALPSAEHVELDCGHIPQLERPREAHAAIERFLEAG